MRKTAYIRVKVEQQNEKTEEMEVNINAKILFQAKYIREEHTSYSPKTA